jgi:hypothetical protein
MPQRFRRPLMDRPVYGRDIKVELQGMVVDQVDLETIRGWAIEEFTAAGNATMAVAWVRAVDRYLTKSLNNSGDSSNKRKKG